MAVTRNSGPYSVGATPPEVTWTVVRGDTAAFKVYVTDDVKSPLNLPDWTIKMQIKRSGTLILDLSPLQDADDAPGEFTVSLTSEESEVLETGDIFDIQLNTLGNTDVWTVAMGSMIIIEDVTD
jgi:hypothetical protein